MDISDFGGPSKYLSKSDITNERGLLLTIKSVVKTTVGRSNETKNVLTFVENVKPMICNKTNAKRIAEFTGISKNVDTAWVGVKIVVYVDPNVEMGGDIVGGLRVRAPKLPPGQPARQPVQQPRQTAPPAPDEYDQTVPAGYDEQGGGMDGDF